MRKRLNKKGFTLIELIVVIAVIGILVLLAAPRFLGYTRDAHVSAMKADAKILSNAALVYHIDNEVREEAEAWPVAYKEGKVDDTKKTTFSVKRMVVPDGGGEAIEETVEVTALPLDESKLDKKYIKNLKNEIKDYVIVVNSEKAPDLEGEVFFAKGSEDRLGKVWHGVDLEASAVEVEFAGPKAEGE